MAKYKVVEDHYNVQGWKIIHMMTFDGDDIFIHQPLTFYIHRGQWERVNIKSQELLILHINWYQKSKTALSNSTKILMLHNINHSHHKHNNVSYYFSVSVNNQMSIMKVTSLCIIILPMQNVM